MDYFILVFPFNHVIESFVTFLLNTCILLLCEPLIAGLLTSFVGPAVIVLDYWLISQESMSMLYNCRALILYVLDHSANHHFNPKTTSPLFPYPNDNLKELFWLHTPSTCDYYGNFVCNPLRSDAYYFKVRTYTNSGLLPNDVISSSPQARAYIGMRFDPNHRYVGIEPVYDAPRRSILKKGPGLLRPNRVIFIEDACIRDLRLNALRRF